jgi:hypothetical protein
LGAAILTATQRQTVQQVVQTAGERLKVAGDVLEYTYSRVLPICIALYGQLWDVWCMSKTTLSPIDLSAAPVPLAAAAVHSLMQTLPAGTAFCIGIVFMVMLTGR